MTNTLDKNNLPLSYIKVLGACDKKYINQIAKKLGMSSQNLNKTYIKPLIFMELITKRKLGRVTEIALTRDGFAVLGEYDTIHNPIPTYRIHNFWLTLQLRTPLADTDTTRLLINRGIRLTSSRALNNHTDSFFLQDGYEACLTPSSLQIHLPDLDNLVLDTDLKEATLNLMVKLEPILLKLEAQLGINVVRLDRDTIIARVSQLHIALKDHKFAETINERGEKLYEYVDGVLRVIVDRSHGIHEYEAVDPTHAPEDAQRLGKLTKGTITGAFDYEQVNAILLGTAKNLDRLASESENFASNLQAHAQAIGELRDMAGKVNATLDRINGTQGGTPPASPRIGLWERLRRWRG